MYAEIKDKLSLDTDVAGYNIVNETRELSLEDLMDHCDHSSKSWSVFTYTHRSAGFLSLGTTLFHRTRNFYPCEGICPFSRSFCVFTRILWNSSVMSSDKGENTADFGQVWVAIDN